MTRAIPALLLCCGVLGCALPCGAAPRADADAALDASLGGRIDPLARHWLTKTGAPSVSLAVVRNGVLVYAAAYGKATTVTRYAVDSLTKEFTAAAILLCAERGALSLDDPLGRWLTDVGAASQVTLREMLSHTSGLRDYWPQDFVTPEMTRPVTPDDFAREWVKRPLDFEPGTDWQYSNTNYVMAARVLERACGEPYFEFLRRHLFLPLSMNRVTQRGDPVTNDEAAGYTRAGLGPRRAAPLENADWLFGAAGLVMRPTDVALWDISLIGRSLLQPGSYDAEFRPTLLDDGRDTGYGLGLEVGRWRDRLRLGHTGSGSGFLSENRVWPGERAAIVVLTNNDWAAPSALLDEIAFLILPPSAAEARARAIFAALQTGVVDRNEFTAIGNAQLSARVLEDLHSSLRTLGPAVDIELEHVSQRGGMITRRWAIHCADAELEAVERGYPDGKLDQFTVTKRI